MCVSPGVFDIVISFFSADFHNMPKRCIVAGCSNTPANGVSLHVWPKDSRTDRLWRNFVKQTRGKWSGPSASSHICSSHFTDDQFSNKRKFDEGFDKYKKLMDGAVPSIYPQSTTQKLATESRQDSATPGRSAYKKREVNRIISDFVAKESKEKEAALLDESLAADASPPTSTELFMHMPLGQSQEAYTQTDTLIVKNATTTTDPRLLGSKISYRSKGMQTDPKFTHKHIEPHSTEETSVQNKSTERLPAIPLPQRASTPILSSSESESDEKDITWEMDEAEKNMDERMGQSTASDKVYLVYRSKLWQLLENCTHCFQPCEVEEISTNLGSLIRIKQYCHRCCYSKTWDSQPFEGNVPKGNIAISGAITFAGLSPTKVIRFMEFAGIETISTSTYHRHCKDFIYPAVYKCWQEEQARVLDVLKGRGKLQCAGDGRADSPGHCAKYGTYTLLETDINKIVTIEIVQSNEVGGSARMEKEGLLRCLAYVHSHGLDLDILVTDRHPSIQKTMREKFPQILHYYDIWHVAKGFSKKAEGLARLKDCEIIRPWIKSMVNHMYWSATSTPDGNPNIIEAKWRSLANHIQDVHIEFEDELFPQCLHRRLTRRDRMQTNWIMPNTLPCEKICALILNTRLCKDVRKLSPNVQTSSVEAIHSLILHWTPKTTAYGYSTMLIRHYIACLHYNENSRRGQQLKLDGEAVYTIVFPKAKGGDFTVKKVKVDPTYSYVGNLFSAIFNCVMPRPSEHQESWRSSFTEPPPLASQYDHPNKEEAIEKFKHTTRYR